MREGARDQNQIGGRGARPARRRLFKMFGALCWLYALAVVGYWLTIHFTSDRWWIGTVLMYSPRWLAATPLCILLPAALLLNRRALCVLVGALVLIAGPIMDFRLPMAWAAPARQAAMRLRVLSCNVDGPDLDAKALAQVMEETRPDIVAIQAWTGRHETDLFAKETWKLRRNGELLLASRFPIGDVSIPTDAWWKKKNGSMAAYDVQVPRGHVRVMNLHLATARHALSAVIDGLWEGESQIMDNVDLRQAQSESASELAKEARQPLLITGDFNMLTDSSTYRRYWSGFTNAFSSAGLGWGFTHFTHRTQLRIDHILTGPGWRVSRCWVGPAVGSAHRPVLADVEWIGARD